MQPAAAAASAGSDPLSEDLQPLVQLAAQSQAAKAAPSRERKTSAQHSEPSAEDLQALVQLAAQSQAVKTAPGSRRKRPSSPQPSSDMQPAAGKAAAGRPDSRLPPRGSIQSAQQQAAQPAARSTRARAGSQLKPDSSAQQPMPEGKPAQLPGAQPAARARPGSKRQTAASSPPSGPGIKAAQPAARSARARGRQAASSALVEQTALVSGDGHELSVKQESEQLGVGGSVAERAKLRRQP